MDKTILKDILSPFWYDRLSKLILENSDWETFLGESRELTFPKLDDTFKAINHLKDGAAKIIVFGQDPYPREESAVGIAFWDGRVDSWESKKLSPSLRNIFKSILINENLVKKETKIAQMREVIKDNNIISPIEFFENSIKNGVVWLNSSLTFTSKSTKDLKRHLKFWNPIVEEIISTLLESNDELIFIFWGNKSKLFQKFINSCKTSCNYHFIENCHPMLNDFHKKNNFSEIDTLTKISWI